MRRPIFGQERIVQETFQKEKKQMIKRKEDLFYLIHEYKHVLEVENFKIGN